MILASFFWWSGWAVDPSWPRYYQNAGYSDAVPFGYYYHGTEIV